ncbi:MAG: hypothetical protein R3A80_02840 [Bdellovibrionota bacterium]
MKIFFQYFLVLLSLLGPEAFAAFNSIYDRSPDTEDILNHRNRRLPPPPKNIKSNKFNPSERFEVALERSEAVVTLSDSEEEGSSSSSYEVLLGTNRKIRDKSVSLGVVGGGSSGVVGVRADVKIEPVWLSAQLGTGGDYMTWGVGARKYLFPRLRFLPFLDVHYSEWLLKEADSTAADYPFPAYATKKFFENSYEKQTARLLSPGLGVAYLGRDGLGVELGAQYLYSLQLEQGAVLGSLGLVKYF